MTLDALNQRIKAEIEKDRARFLTEQFGRGGVPSVPFFAPKASKYAQVMLEPDAPSVILAATTGARSIFNSIELTSAWLARGTQSPDRKEKQRMTYEALKQRTIEAIREAPARFLYGQFREYGAFEHSIFARNGLNELPIIMHVIDGDQFSLLVTIWDYVVDSFSKTTYKAHGIPNENGMLLWALDVSAYDAYSDVQDADRFLPEIIIGEALEEWEEIAASIAARGDSREYAWLFPCGLKPALNHAGMTMFASNRDAEQGR